MTPDPTPTAASPADHLYHYAGTVVDVYDGDTIRVNVDLGFRVTLGHESFRLARIDAPEVKGLTKPAGLTARDWLRSTLMDRRVILRTIKDSQEKYGRYLADVFYTDEAGVVRCANDDLVARGFARYRTY